MPSNTTIRHIRNSSVFTTQGEFQSFGCPLDWKAVCEGEKLDEGLRAALRTFENGRPISREIAYCLLQGCSKKNDLDAGKAVLSLIRKSNLELVAPLGDPLIRIFAAHGHLGAACKVFSRIKNPGSHSWHAIISAHVSMQENNKAISLFCCMLDHDVAPTKFMVSYILKACTCTRGLQQGMVLHDQIFESSFETEVFIGSILVSLYAKCGCLGESRRVLNCFKLKTTISYNTLMSGYIQYGENSLAWDLFEEMQKSGIPPDHYTFSCVLKACGGSKSASKGAYVHEMVSKHGFSVDIVVGNALIDMYFNCGNTLRAQEVFDMMPRKDIVTWNTLLKGYSSTEVDFDALKFYEKMQGESITSTRITYLCIIKACSNISAVKEGTWVHDKIIKKGLATDVKIGSALVLMYAYSGRLDDAQCIFDLLSDKDSVLWCTMITAYAETGCPLIAIELYEKMQYNDVEPDNACFVCILKACANSKALSCGKSVHDHLSICGLESDVVLRNSLINMYSKCGRPDAAVELFEDFPHKNLVSWNAMINGYALNELGFPALELFARMLGEGLKPDNLSFLGALKASASSGAILQGRLLHDILNRAGFLPDTQLDFHLIDMYAKCGSLEEACRVYELAREERVSPWGNITLMPGYLCQDCDSLAVLGPDSEIQNCPTGNMMHAACGKSNKVEKRTTMFSSVMDGRYKDPSSLVHYNFVIDNLGRTGSVNDAQCLLQTMPFLPDIFGWMSVLTACKIYGYSQLGQQCREKILLVKPSLYMLDFAFKMAESNISETKALIQMQR